MVKSLQYAISVCFIVYKWISKRHELFLMYTNTYLPFYVHVTESVNIWEVQSAYFE